MQVADTQRLFVADARLQFHLNGPVLLVDGLGKQGVEDKRQDQASNQGWSREQDAKRNREAQFAVCY